MAHDLQLQLSFKEALLLQAFMWSTTFLGCRPPPA